MKKISEWTFIQKLARYILAFIGLLFLVAYLGALIIPNSSILIDNPMLHQGLAYGVIIAVFALSFLILLIHIYTAVERYELERKNEEKDKKIAEFERELRRLKED